MAETRRQFARFALVGAIAFLIDYAVMVSCVEVFHLHYVAGATIGFILANSFNYILSRNFVFSKAIPSENKARECAAFFAMAAIGLAVNNICMLGFTEIGNMPDTVSKLLATAIVAIYNFGTRKWLFH